MTQLQGGHRNLGHRIYCPSRTIDSVKAELLQFLSWTPSVGTTGQGATTIGPDDRERVSAPDPGTDSMAIAMRWFPDANAEQRYLLSGETVALEFSKLRRPIATPGAAARVSIAQDTGLCTFSGAGHISAEAIQAGYHFLVGGLLYEIRAVRPAAGADEVVSDITMNRIYVNVGDGGLGGSLDAAAYACVRGEATTGSVSGTIIGPKLAGVGADSTGYQEETITFTPSGGLPEQATPAAMQPDYA